MGYAKYSEDVTDRLVDDTRDREDAFYRQWRVDHVPTPPPPPGEVYLEVEGHRLEDEELFPAGNSIKIKSVVSEGSAPVDIAIVSGGRRSLLVPDAVGVYTVVGRNAETVEIDAASGACHRFHTLHFVEIAHIDRIDGILEAINRFTANPPGWTREEFEDFRVRLRRLLAKSSFPQSFADGLVEYFLGVQLEASENPAFRDRLEAAFIILRRFVPFSDIAALIAEYFRYRTNTFCESTEGEQKRPLYPVRQFFTHTKGSHDEKAGELRGIELVVPEVEFCCIEAIRAMLRGDFDAALGMVAVSRKLEGRLRDPQREERLTLIEARAYVEAREQEKARNLYQLLVNSPCRLFQQEAREFLRR